MDSLAAETPTITNQPERDLSGLQSDMQDVLYGAIYHDRYDTSEDALDALLPIVKRYAAIKLGNELRYQADKIEAGADDYIRDGASDLIRERSYEDKRLARNLRTRADEVDGGAR